jgi:hypothetical protein
VTVTLRATKGYALTHAELDANFSELDDGILKKRCVVNQANAATILGGTIDSTKEYFIDGVIDMSGIEITVPSGGINIRGYNFDLSKLENTANNETLFSSTAAGNILILDLGIKMSGTGSKVYDLKSNTGFEAVELIRVNFNDCTSLGTLDNFRQGLESGTGRFGGTPELELKGVWVGGYALLTSIMRSTTAGSWFMFKAGTGFTMSSRFRSDANLDFPASSGFFDFAAANFPNSSTLILNGRNVTRAGTQAPDDALYTPNIDHTALASFWSNNIGLNNTFVGGTMETSNSVATTVSVQGDLYDLDDSTWGLTNAQHFDEPANGQARHLGDSPREYRVQIDIILESAANAELRLEMWKYDSSATSSAMVRSVTRQVNSLVGARDVAFFDLAAYVTLDQNDYIYFRAANDSGTQDITAEANSVFTVEAR